MLSKKKPLLLIVDHLPTVNNFLLDIRMFKVIDYSEEVVKNIYNSIYAMVIILANDITGEVYDDAIHKAIKDLKVDKNEALYNVCYNMFRESVPIAAEQLSEMDMHNATVYVNVVNRNSITIEIHTDSYGAL